MVLLESPPIDTNSIKSLHSAYLLTKMRFCIHHFTCSPEAKVPRSTKMPGAFWDSFSWPAKQANPRDGVSNPVGCTKHKKTTVRWFLCFWHPARFERAVRPPVCREQTGTAPLARKGEYQDDTSSMQDSLLGRSEATPGRARRRKRRAILVGTPYESNA